MTTTVAGHQINHNDVNDDDGVDNCLELANPQQRDTNGDGYGNFYAADFHHDNVVYPNDYNTIFARFFTGFPNAYLRVMALPIFSIIFLRENVSVLPPGPSALAAP